MMKLTGARKVWRVACIMWPKSDVGSFAIEISLREGWNYDCLA